MHVEVGLHGPLLIPQKTKRKLICGVTILNEKYKIWFL